MSRQVRRAVERNRVRRRLRAAYRTARSAAPVGVDLVIVGRPSALREPFDELVAQLQGALGTIPGPRAA